MTTQPANAPAAAEVPAESRPHPESHDRVANALVANGFLSAEQLRHAQRVRGKLAAPKALLRVLQDLRYVTRDHIQRVLVTNLVRIPLGGLLLELGMIGESELDSALAIQKQRPGIKLGQILVEHRVLDEK